jgi:hypothetical protein
VALQVAGSLRDQDEWEIEFPRSHYTSLDFMQELDVDTSQFTTMLHRLAFRGSHSRKLKFKPQLERGSYIFTVGGALVGRVTRIEDNLDRNDWFADATEWTVWYEKPWQQSDVTLSGGSQAKIEWLEDELLPRVGQLTRDSGPFRAGDIVHVVAARPDTLQRSLFERGLHKSGLARLLGR